MRKQWESTLNGPPTCPKDGVHFTFLNTWLGVNLIDSDAGNEIHGQRTPRVVALADNPVFWGTTRWWVDGLTQEHSIDAVEPLPSCVSLAEFLNPAGNGGSYTIAAATYNYVDEYVADVILLPHAFSSIGTDIAEESSSPLAARTRMLSEILTFLGHPPGSGEPSSVADIPPFTMQGYPTPFNATLNIRLEMPLREHLLVEVYDIRGRRVAVVADEIREPGTTFVHWDGRADRGGRVGSGLYFLRAEAGDLVRVQRVSLVK